ncbi:MAG: valine--tRNA ligase [Candidatus Paracaedibacteraceae bacterium]|nr:valine--tRNA ligase [Candidatus Paracaedibacteraceae bacterium]
MTTLTKNYEHQDVQEKLYESWSKKGLFSCNPLSSKEPFTIMMPPPNVTGNLHLGHALTYTIQDVLLRYQRMKGKDTLYQPGTDHAGIATQMLVERQLNSDGLNRHEMGREKFLSHVWAWKEKYGSAIVGQQKKMGITADWERSRFTMDEGLSEAVRKVFVELYKQKLIYRDKRLVNWDCKLLTAVSDLEVEEKEIKGKMYYIRYPLVSDASKYIVVGTTRPETLFGDVAVAVHPDDERYQALIGKFVRIPLNGREIPIVGDEYPDPEKGTGAVKITPAHDFNDFEVGVRHDLDKIIVMDIHGKMNENCPAEYQGLDRFDARKKVIEALEGLECLEKVEDHKHLVPHGDRSGTQLEPRLTDQWFVDAEVLAKKALEAVETGETVFVPDNWKHTYFEWLRNIRPWCISRQIWWGHRVPAWYGPDGKVFVCETETQAHSEANQCYGKSVELTQDEDVLDTWFSSALWPFSTLGWPEKTIELDRYYSTDVLVTGFDIIFFWVARMMMMGMHFMGKVPFKVVYIHPLIRDEKGQKMSKTKGNVIDPLVVIEQYGADALRMTLSSLAVHGRDVRMSMDKVESSRNFVTKLWNAAKYAQMHNVRLIKGFNPAATAKLTVNRWIAGMCETVTQEVTANLDEYKLHDAASGLYAIVRNTFCDWYIEFTKTILNGDDEEAKAETRATMAWVLKRLLVLLQPIMPYVTDEIWSAFRQIDDPEFLVEESWPAASEVDHSSVKEMEWISQAITAIRGTRAELNVPVATIVQAQVTFENQEEGNYFQRNQSLIERLARVTFSGKTEKPLNVIVGQAVFNLNIRDVIDLDAERSRLEKEKTKVMADLKVVTSKLQNEDFVARAPAEIINENKQREVDLNGKLKKIENSLLQLN